MLPMEQEFFSITIKIRRLLNYNSAHYWPLGATKGFFRNGAGLAAQTTTIVWEPNFADATVVEASHL